MPVFTSSIEVTADYPTIKPSLNLNFARSRALDPRITFTRASVGTYVGRDGLVKTASNDEPRFDHDPDTLESLGLLIEESRTNTLTYSSNHQQDTTHNFLAGYTTTVHTKVTNIDPPVEGDEVWIIEDQGSGDYAIKSDGTTATGVVSYTIFVKRYDSDTVVIASHFGSSVGTFNLANGTFTNGAYGAQMIPYPNGWYKITWTRDYSSQNRETGITINPDPNGTGVYVSGTQIEVGSFPTSYIPTTGSSVTRAQDDAIITGESFNSFYNQNEGSLFVESTPMYLASGINHRVCVITGDSNFTDSNAPGGINFDYDGTTLRTELFGGSPNSAQAGTGLTVSAGNKNKLAYGLETNNVSVIVNGTQVGSTDTSAPMPDPMTKMGIGRRPDISTTYADGIHVSSIQYYPKRLTNAQLQLLTS